MRTIDDMLTVLNSFPQNREAKAATSEIEKAIDRATQQIAELEAARQDAAQERATMAADAFLQGKDVSSEPDGTQGKIDALNEVIAGLRQQVQTAKQSESTAMIEDLRIHAALLKAETDPAVERANILLDELRELAPKLRFLNGRSSELRSLWSRKGFERPSPATGAVPRNLQGLEL